MPGCCVEGCNNRSERGFRLFCVPKNEGRRHEWLQLIGRKTLPERAEICEVINELQTYETFMSYITNYYIMSYSTNYYINFTGAF